MEGLTTQGRIESIFINSNLYSEPILFGNLLFTMDITIINAFTMNWFYDIIGINFLVTRHADFSVLAYRKKTNMLEQKGNVVSTTIIFLIVNL